MLEDAVSRCEQLELLWAQRCEATVKPGCIEIANWAKRTDPSSFAGRIIKCFAPLSSAVCDPKVRPKQLPFRITGCKQVFFCWDLDPCEEVGGGEQWPHAETVIVDLLREILPELPAHAKIVFRKHALGHSVPNLSSWLYKWSHRDVSAIAGGTFVVC